MSVTITRHEYDQLQASVMRLEADSLKLNRRLDKLESAGSIVNVTVRVDGDLHGMEKRIMAKLEEQEVALDTSLAALQTSVTDMTARVDALATDLETQIADLKAALEAANQGTNVDLTDELASVDALSATIAAFKAVPVEPPVG